MATPTLQNYIDGRWVDATDRGTFENINPATGELIANVAKSTVADVDRAVDAARRALDGWRLYPAPKRGEILFRAGEIMLTRKDDLAREMTREMGKVIAEARGDVQEGIDMTYYIAGEGRRQFGDVVPAELPNKWAMSTRHPVGVVAAITPWNFPFAIPTWKIMPALILGNTIVFKPASYTPLLAVRLVEILEEAGLPKGVINLVLGSGGELGDHIVSHPGVDLISFTGSSDTGSHISEIGGRLLKRVSCELGGKNAIVVLDDADVDLSLDGIVWSAKGFFHEPTVLVDVKPNMRVAQEEIFGPVTAVIEVSTIDEAIKAVNSTKYGLSSSIYTRNVNNAFRFMRDAETGMVYVNAGTIGAEIQLPFGGMKATGNGHREAGRAALDVYSEWKSIYVDYSGKLQRAQMDPEGTKTAP